MSPKRTKTSVALCSHGDNKASFEACFVDLGCLEKQNFSIELLENSRKHHAIVWLSLNPHKASSLRPVCRLSYRWC